MLPLLFLITLSVLFYKYKTEPLLKFQLDTLEAIEKVSTFNLNLMIGGVIAVLIAKSRELKEQRFFLRGEIRLIFVLLFACFFLILGGFVVSSEWTLSDPPYATFLAKSFLAVEVGISVYLLVFLMWVMNKSRK